MKILDKINIKCGEQVPVSGRFAIVESENKEPLRLSERPEQWKWDYGIRIHCDFVGPPTASENLAYQARRMIAKELFGEITDDLFQLKRLLMEESYRPIGDPVMAIIDNLIKETRGL